MKALAVLKPPKQKHDMLLALNEVDESPRFQQAVLGIKFAGSTGFKGSALNLTSRSGGCSVHFSQADH